MDPQALHGSLTFLREAERLKNVLRSARTSNGRAESTAEHSWRLCLLAMVFERELPGVDFARLLKICVLHDLGEAIHGDIPAIHQTGGTDKAARERADLLTLLQTLPQPVHDEFLALWDEYDQVASPEARLVKGLDKLETILQHNQGANAPDFDYGFNLGYGRQHTATHPLLQAIRDILDADTLRHHQASPRAA